MPVISNARTLLLKRYLTRRAIVGYIVYRSKHLCKKQLPQILNTAVGCIILQKMIETGSWIEKDEFEKDLKLPGERIVLFAADWCGYCRRFISLLSNYKGSEGASREIIIVNVESGDGSLWDKYKVDLVPTLVVFKDGKETFRRGARPSVGLRESDLKDVLEAS
jgi:thioredoxin 1